MTSAPPSTMIFIHGGGVGPWMWAAQAAFFSRRHRVLTPTLPGHDAHQPEEFTTHAEAARSVAAQTALPDTEGPITLIGFSLGGQTAIQLAAAYPQKVNRLVVVSSLLAPRRTASVTAALASAAAPLSRARPFARVQAAQLLIPKARFDDYYALSKRISGQTLSNLIRVNFSFAVPANVLSSHRPVLLMAGKNEKAGLLSDMAGLHARLPGSSLQIHPGVGHGLPLSHPGRFNQAVSRWLTATDPSVKLP